MFVFVGGGVGVGYPGGVVIGVLDWAYFYLRDVDVLGDLGGASLLAMPRSTRSISMLWGRDIGRRFDRYGGDGE